MVSRLRAWEMALRFTWGGTLCGALAIACLLAAGPAQASHPRPKSASPVRMPLVPAHAACTAPNRTHGPPLAFGSCNPPAQSSLQATVGTPDAFGGAANAVGGLRLKLVMCQSNCPTDDEDIRVDIALDDVRCLPTGTRCGAANAAGPADYSGEMRFQFTVRVSDHWNATAPGGGTDPATVQDFDMDVSWPCVQSGSTSTGSTCNSATSLRAILPGSVRDAKRAVWELDAVRIYDGGYDGDGDTVPDNTVFARPGIFVP